MDRQDQPSEIKTWPLHYNWLDPELRRELMTEAAIALVRLATLTGDLETPSVAKKGAGGAELDEHVWDR